MEPAVADTPVTKRQKFWRDHVLAAAAYDGTIVEYAKANGHEPYAYFLTVFTKLQAAKTREDIEASLPFNLKPVTGNAAFSHN